MRTLFFSVTLCLGVVGCGGGNLITIAVTPSATAAVNDGQSPTQIAATIQASGAPAPDGTSVTFTVNSNTSASFAPFAPMTPATSSMMVMTAGGVATVPIYDIADESVTITITAALSDSAGNPYNIPGTATIVFGSKCKDGFVSATPKSLQSGVPASITLSCQSDYMGGVFAFDIATEQLFAGNTQGCTASVNDASLQSVGGAAVQFLTEAGTFETDVQATGQHPTEITDPTGVANVQFHASAPYPEDVEPGTDDGTLISAAGGTATIQRSWSGSDPNTGAMHTYNPRDGWVTMIAATPGIPGSQAGPCMATKCGEPFVDSNDNGTWDLGEPYIDANCNGQYDAQQTPNSQGFVDIWTSKTIVWTDGLWTQADCSEAYPKCIGTELLGLTVPNAFTGLAPGKTFTGVFRFVDKNLNLYATFLQSPNNQLTFTPNPSVLSPSPTTIPLGQALDVKALVLNPDFPVTVTDTVSASSSTAACSVTAAAEFIFGDTQNPANTALAAVLDQTISITASGTCAQ